jgi:hypothetical protein
MKARFNYDLAEVFSLLEKTKAASSLVAHPVVCADRDDLLRRAELLVHQMEERAHEAAQGQTAQLDHEKVRRLLRKM